MNELIVKPNKDITSDEAFGLDKEIKQLRRGSILDFWRMIHRLGKMREYRGWGLLGYDSWESYLAQPEISYAPETARKYIETYLTILNYIKCGNNVPVFDIVNLDPVELNFDIKRGILLKPYVNDDLLEKAEALSYSDFLKEIEALKPPTPALKPAKGKYQVITIDPPWKYGTEYDPEGRRVASPYPEIPTWIKDKTDKDKSSLEEFKIPADDNSVIWLWTTHSFLPDALELLKIWGFTYKACLVWDKQKMGMGSWLRMQAEFCLLGAMGKREWKLENQRDIISSPRREHSRKPDEFYQLAEELWPNAKRIDIFSREKRKGWKQYGNEPDKLGK